MSRTRTRSITCPALNNFLVELEGGGSISAQVADVAFNNTLDNSVNDFTGSANTVDITNNIAINAGGGATGAFTTGVLNNHGITLSGVNNGAATITATDTNPGGLGTGAETGTSAVFSAEPDALQNFLVEAQAGGAIGPRPVQQHAELRRQRLQ
jgi:hypothetical protein